MTMSYSDWLEHELKHGDDPVDLAFLVFMMPILLPMEIFGKMLQSAAGENE